MNVVLGLFLFFLQNIGSTPVLESHLKMLYNNSKEAEKVIKSPRQDEDGGDEGNLVSSIAQTLTGVANNVFTDNFKFGNALAESAQILPGDAGETVSGFLNSVAEPINAVVGNPFQQFQEYLDQNFPITTSTPKPKPKTPTTKAPTIATTKAPTVSHVFFVHQAPTTNLPALIPIKPSLPNKSGGPLSLAASISSLPINSNSDRYKRPIHSQDKPISTIPPVSKSEQATNSNNPASNPPPTFPTTSVISNKLIVSPTTSSNAASTKIPPISNSKNTIISNSPTFSNINAPASSKIPIGSNSPALSNINAPVSSKIPIGPNSSTLSNINAPAPSKLPIGPNSSTLSNINAPASSKIPISPNSPAFSNNFVSNSAAFSKNPISNSPTFSKAPIGSNLATFSKIPISSESSTFLNGNKIKETTSKFSQLLLNNNQPTTKRPLSGPSGQSFSELLLAGNRPTITNSLLREQPQQNANQAQSEQTNLESNFNRIEQDRITTNPQSLNALSTVMANNHQLTSNNHQLTSNNHQLISNNHQLTSNNHQLTSNNQQVPTNNQQVPTNNQQVPTNNQQVPINNQQVHNQQVPTNNQQVPTNNQQIPTNNQQVPTNNQQIPTNNQQVPSQNFIGNFRPPADIFGGRPPIYNGTGVLRPNNLGNPNYPIPPPVDEDEDGEDEDGEDGDGNRVAKTFY